MTFIINSTLDFNSYSPCQKSNTSSCVNQLCEWISYFLKPLVITIIVFLNKVSVWGILYMCGCSLTILSSTVVPQRSCVTSRIYCILPSPTQLSSQQGSKSLLLNVILMRTLCSKLCWETLAGPKSNFHDRSLPNTRTPTPHWIPCSYKCLYSLHPIYIPYLENSGCPYRFRS